MDGSPASPNSAQSHPPLPSCLQHYGHHDAATAAYYAQHPDAAAAGYDAAYYAQHPEAYAGHAVEGGEAYHHHAVAADSYAAYGDHSMHGFEHHHAAEHAVGHAVGAEAGGLDAAGAHVVADLHAELEAHAANAVPAGTPSADDVLNAVLAGQHAALEAPPTSDPATAGQA